MIRDEQLAPMAAAQLTEELATTTPTIVNPVDESDDDSVESADDLDIQEILHLLDQVWPRDDSDQERIPRKFGRFSIEAELGRGGFGVVYLAEDPLLKRKVALKLPRIGIVSGTETWRRFLREARAASRLDHPNVIRLLEAGTIGPLGYIVSVYVPGPSLEQWLRHKRRAVSARWGAQIVATLAHAIEHAHQRGILHRDLKPANVLLYAPECEGDSSNRRAWENGNVESWPPRICDFGMAKLREAEGDETRSRVACGSPPYMAPEQAEARQMEIGPETDVYGLGAILYQILTGRPPFSGKNNLETLCQVVDQEPAAPRTLSPGVPRDLETICLKCLAKKPAQRYLSAAALADDLERFLDGRPITARPVAAWERGWRWSRRHPAPVALANAILLAAAAGISGLLWHDARLRQVNERLRLAVIESDASAQEARNQRSRVETHEWSLRRQLASRHISGAQQLAIAGEFDRALQTLDSAAPEFVANGKGEFPWSFLRQSIRERFEIFDAGGAAVHRIVAARDGRTIALADITGAVQLWDLPTGKRRRLESEKCKEIHYLVFSPDGHEIAASTTEAGEIFLWDVASGRLRGTLDRSGHRAVSALLYSRDGRRLAALGRQPGAGVRPVEYWDVSSSAANLSIVAPEDDPPLIAEMTDARLRTLAEFMDDRSPSSFGSLAELRKSWLERAPRGIERTKDHKIGLIAQGDGTFVVYHLWRRLPMATGRIGAHGSALAMFSYERPIWQEFQAEHAAIGRLAEKLIPHSAGKPVPPDIIFHVVAMDETGAFSPDGSRLAVWSHDETSKLKIFDLRTGLLGSTFPLEVPARLNALSFTSDGATLAFGGAERRLRLWRFQAASNPVVLRGHAPKEAWSLSFSPDGQTLASGGDDHFVRLWNMETGEERAVLRGHDVLVTSVAFAPDGRTLASASLNVEKPVALWDAATWTLRSVLRGHIAPARSVSFSPDSRTLASSSDDESVILYDVHRHRRKATLWPHFDGVFRSALSPDGRTLGSAAKNVLVFTDLVGGGARSVSTGSSEILSLVFAPDGSHLTTGHVDGMINTWDVATGRQTQTISGHSSIVFGLALSPDGRTLASAGEDRTVRVWDVITGQELLCLTDCKARVNAVAFSHDGLTLAAADHTGAITLWRVGVRD
jgi:eukaryotic-like serine/threonine-protein kinase